MTLGGCGLAGLERRCQRKRCNGFSCRTHAWSLRFSSPSVARGPALPARPLLCPSCTRCTPRYVSCGLAQGGQAAAETGGRLNWTSLRGASPLLSIPAQYRRTAKPHPHISSRAQETGGYILPGCCGKRTLQQREARASRHKALSSLDVGLSSRQWVAAGQPTAWTSARPRRTSCGCAADPPVADLVGVAPCLNPLPRKPQPCCHTMIAQRRAALKALTKSWASTGVSYG